MAIKREFIDELVARADVYDVVSRYVALKKSGTNYFGLCPFHSEKTASFSVSTSKQIYHCFSCGAGGGVIGFIMQVENLAFVDAVHFLAALYNLEVPEDGKDEFKEMRSRVLSLQKIAARYFYDRLHDPKNQGVMEYCLKRGLKKRDMNNFGVGYAEDSWTALMDYLIKEGYSKEEILASGLILNGKNGGFYDRFRGRLIFPIIDVRNNVVAFGGRVLDDSLPKYLNSPESLVYNKSRNLFALNLAKKTKGDFLILAEGYMDVIALHGAGFDGAVASLGTSLTEDQARLIKRYKNKVIIAYDADNAGQKATTRAIELLKKEDIEIKVLKTPGAKDPDEFIKKNGADAFRRLIESSENDMDYRILTIQGRYDLENIEERIGFIGEATAMLAGIDNTVIQEVYAGKVAKAANLGVEAVMNELKKKRKQRLSRVKNEEKRKVLSPITMAQPKDRSLSYSDPKSAKAEEGILSLIFEDNALMDSLSGRLRPEDFSSEFLGQIYEAARESHLNGELFHIASFEMNLPPGQLTHLVQILARPVLTIGREKALEDYISIIHQRAVLRGSDLDLSRAFENKK